MLSPPRAAAPAEDGRLERLLRSLPVPVRRGGGPGLPEERQPTGLEPLDALLGGGFPRGRVSEIAGPASCGRTSLAHALLARATAGGGLACVIDRADAFDPISARDGGVDLARVLWARPPGVPEALRCAEHVLRAGGFALVLLDLAMAHETPRVSQAVWPRVRKLVASTSAAFVTLSHQRLIGTFADLALELGEARPCFEAGPAWLEGLDGRVALVRNRLGPDGRSVPVRWRAESEPTVGNGPTRAEDERAA